MIVTTHSKFTHHHAPRVEELPSPEIDDVISAWQIIFSQWHTSEWKPIPPEVRYVIRFHPQLGMCGGNLCTRTASIGMQQFINRLNGVRS